MKKEFQSALFSPLGLWTGNNSLVKGGLRSVTLRQSGQNSEEFAAPYTSPTNKPTNVTSVEARNRIRDLILRRRCTQH